MRPYWLAFVLIPMAHGQTSSKCADLTNFKIPGVIVVSFLLGLALSAIERRIRRGARLFSLVAAAGLSYAIVGQEAPLIVTAAGLLSILLRTAASVRAAATNFMRRCARIAISATR